jgi:hypothetical protein
MSLFEQVYSWNGRFYVPFHSVPVAAGPFLPPSINSVEQHLELPAENEFRHNIRMRCRHLSAARVRGHSMMYRDICDVIVFQRSGFEYVEHDKVVVIERIGEEEGFGASRSLSSSSQDRPVEMSSEMRSIGTIQLWCSILTIRRSGRDTWIPPADTEFAGYSFARCGPSVCAW